MNLMDMRADYLDLLKKVLVDYFSIGYDDGTIFHSEATEPDLAGRVAIREVGRDWPQRALSMSGLVRLSNFQQCIETVIRDGIAGDIVEAGVWRGGASILARAVLQSLGVDDRVVWLVDSFAGLPAPDAARYPRDRDLDLSRIDYLRASLEDVQENFRRFGLLDAQVRFVKGWFRDTLPTIEIGKIAVARLDGDLYESTMIGLENLYPRISPGGFVILDDYFLISQCRAAVDDFRRANGIDTPVAQVDHSGGYWRLPA
jgi:O-methyltransferase